MKVFITHSIDLFSLYFSSWLEKAHSLNEICIVNEDDNNMTHIKSLPSIEDILSYINNFISYQQKKNHNILTYYFILDDIKKLHIPTKIANQFIVNIKKFYTLFIEAIKRRISTQCFYVSASVDKIESDKKAIKNIESNIGKNNIIMFSLHSSSAEAV